MPELPEVETVRRDLARWEGAMLVQIRIQDQKVWFESDLKPEWFANRQLERIFRRGKYIAYDFGGGYLLQHLRMTGKMLPKGSAALPKKLRSNLQIRAVFEFAGEDSIYFFDTRRFGTLTAVKDIEKYWQKKGIAPDPFEDSIEAARAHYYKKIVGRNRPIKNCILDQTILAGVGNIYADEALHRARIYPERLASTLGKNKLEELFEAMLAVFTEAIDKRGTTSSDYLDVHGNPGIFQKYLNVYRRAGEQCKSCGKSEVKRITLAGRGTHYCPWCQPAR